MKSKLEDIQPTKSKSPKINTESENYIETVKEQLARNEQYFGENSLKKIKNSKIIVVGVGGVGSHVAAQLIRAGVGHVKVIDFDLVTLSSLNRHAFAVRKDVGISKVQCIANYASEILPHVKVDVENKMFSAQNADELISFGEDENGEKVKIGNIM
jgi:tRNA A37 threonylcarbamoyladenosine dehydratase